MNIEDSRLLPLAFALAKGTTMQMLRELRENGIDYSDLFKMTDIDLHSLSGDRNSRLPDESTLREASIRAREELEYCDSHHIRVIVPDSEEYPQRLLELFDAPKALFAVGDADLNAERMLSFVGTRMPTPYGLNFVKTAIEELGAEKPAATIVSGLAYGIDAASHGASLSAGLPTVAVVAHGLDTIYPSANRDLAKRIVGAGGAIVSEYAHGVKPYRGHFLQRNRIIAAMSDGCIVAESDLRGGAMSTAATAFHANREVMALPGRSSDRFSAGCNNLIRRNIASLVTSAKEILQTMGWEKSPDAEKERVKTLFPELDEPAKSIYEALSGYSEPASIDRLRADLGIAVNVLLSQLGEMEFSGLVIKFPGNRFAIS